MRRILPFLAMVVFFLSCGGSDKTSQQADSPNVVVDFKEKSLPDPGKLLTGREIEQALNLHEGAMWDIVSNGEEGDRSRNAFFKLDDPEKPNGAILIEVKSNPDPVEFPYWDVDYIQGIKESGERKIDSSDPDIFYEFLDLGKEGVGNRDLGKYLWRDEHRHIYMLMFNITKSPDEIHEAALKIAEIVDSKF